MPHGAASNLASATFADVGHALVALLHDESVPAFNLYAIFRLHDDVAALAQLADSLPVAGLAVRPYPHAQTVPNPAALVHPGPYTALPRAKDKHLPQLWHARVGPSILRKLATLSHFWQWQLFDSMTESHLPQ